MQINLKVRRYDPERGGAVRYQQYSLEMAQNSTVLDALIQVREYEDATLALRCSCRSAICGSCAMRIDHQARLACKTKVIDLVNKEGQEITVEPMGNMPVVKDLVTDMEVHWSRVRQVEPWLQPVGPLPEREYLVSNEAMLDLSHTMNCIHCGACVSDCPVLEIDKNFIAPAALAKAYRFVGDPRDGMQKERLQALSKVAGGIWDCTRCNMCVEVCPKGVAPMDRILQLREMAIEAGIKNNAGARHTGIFTKSVEDGGILNEVWMVPGSVGLFNVPRLMKEMPGALKMALAGKLPFKQVVPPGFPGSHKMKGMDRVRNVIRKSASLKPKKPEVTD